MLILIAESKSMSEACAGRCPVGSRPVFEEEASEIMVGLQNLSVEELGTVLKLGPKNAVRLADDIASFGDKTTGCRAIDAFTGVVFRSFDAASLSADSAKEMNKSVRIVSSLYGWLRPSDVVKSYRLEFGMKAAPDGGTLTAYWRNRLTHALLRELQQTGETEILNLMPMDATKCFDWKQIKQTASVYTVSFKREDESGKLVTPHSDNLKRLRGGLLRYIIENDLQKVEELKSVRNSRFAFNEVTSTDIQFLVGD